nr:MULTISPECIES: IS5 family transposase [unclassified Sphingopyxis]
MELGLCPLPALGRTGCLGCPAANTGRSGSNRRLATHDRQHQRSRPCLGSGRKRGACANALGRSRGGFTSKIHARCDNQGLPVGFILTGGEASDYTAAEPLMAIPVATPKALLADKGYDGDRFRESLLVRGILPIIPPRSNRKVPEHPDYRRYKDRNRVERMFSKLKQQRRIATRYDKTLLSFESFLNLAATRLWLKSFVNTA